MFANLDETIERLVPKYTKILEECCKIESPTSNKARVDSCSQYLLDQIKDFGWNVDILNIPDAGDPVCITMNPESNEKPIVLSGHLDTVHPIGSFGAETVRYDGNLMIAPGVTDCKGGVVLGLMAMEALMLCGFKTRPIKMIFQTDEETGSKTSGKKTIDFMIKSSQGAEAFFNLEGTTNLSTIVLERKGIQRFRYHITGKPVHSAKCNEGSNAVAEAAHKILELEKLKDKKGITCNCGVIEGGTVANTVAGFCSFYADFRFLTRKDHENIMRIANEVSEKVYIPGCSCKLENVSYRPGMPDCERNRNLLNRSNEILSAHGMPTVKAELALGGADSAYITEAGIPCLDKFGMAGNHAHCLNEYGDISTMAFSAKRLAVLCGNL